MYILPVLGSGADADNGVAHLVTFIHSGTEYSVHDKLHAPIALRRNRTVRELI
jgi:hypothetical protein